MKQKLTQVNLHGILGDAVGHKTWNLAIKTVGQAMNAIEILSGRKLFKNLVENDKKGIKYRVLINGRDFLHDKANPPSANDPNSIANSELIAKIKNLETIDVVPILEGAGQDFMDIFTIIVGVILIIVGFVISIGSGGLLTPFGAVLVIAGLGLIAAGVINLLSQPPELQEFRDRQKTSFLFSGPVNTVNEGGRIPIGYGRAMIGSSVISAAYDIGYFDANDNFRIVNPDGSGSGGEGTPGTHSPIETQQ